MKTSEFKKRLREIGYVTNDSTSFISIRGILMEQERAKIYKSIVAQLSLDTTDYHLIKLCIEYAETPLLEREEEKKYRVIVPDPEKRGKHVLALGRLVERKGEVIIMRVKKETLESDRCHLTESEIKRNHEYLWQFAKEVER